MPGCPLFERCLTKSQQESKQKVKKVYRDQKEPLAEEMARKLQTQETKQRLKTRMSTVEPTFGNLKQNLGFRKFLLKGLELATGEFNLMCIAHNLNALFVKALLTYFYPLFVRLWRVTIFSVNKNQNLIELPSWSGCAPQKPREAV